MTMQKFLIPLIIFILVVTLGWSAWHLTPAKKIPGKDVVRVDNPLIGGDFSLVNSAGERRHASDYRGKWMLVFFGFTYCPDICPTDLLKMGQVLDALGESEQHIQPLFITIDPERDTPDHLALYLENFDPRIEGLTGSADEIRQAAQAYKVYYARQQEEGESESDYLMNHSAYLYLMDPEGRYAAHFPHDATVDDVVDRVLREMAASFKQKRMTGGV